MSSNGRYENNNRKQGRQSQAMQQWAKGCFLYAVFILVISFIVSFYVLTMANDMFGLVDSADTVTLMIDDQDKIGDVAGKLKDEGVIEYKLFFTLYAKSKNIDKNLEPGSYEIQKNMPYSSIVSNVEKKETVKTKDTVMITIPEGYELKQIVDLLVKEGVATKDELMDVIDNYDFKHSFLANLPDRENRLEGYLFPDTYEFYVGDNPVSVINKMLNNFDDKFKNEYYDRLKEIDMTLDQAVTLASVIEREAANDNERGKVSAVFHNRLKSTQYPFLQSCATVQYILGERKKILSTEDTKIESPYNTYLNKGLPVGPIASPGAASIHAALYPDDVDYLFFVADPDGKDSLFSKTYEEHLANVKKVGGQAAQ